MIRISNRSVDLIPKHPCLRNPSVCQRPPTVDAPYYLQMSKTTSRFVLQSYLFGKRSIRLLPSPFLSAEPSADLGCFIAQPLLARLRQLPMIIRVTSYICSSFPSGSGAQPNIVLGPQGCPVCRRRSMQQDALTANPSSFRCDKALPGCSSHTRVSCDLVTCTCRDVDFPSWIGYSCARFPIAGWHCSYASLGRFSHKPYLHQFLPQLSKKQRRK